MSQSQSPKSKLPGATAAVLITGIIAFAAVAAVGLFLRIDDVTLIAVLGAVATLFGTAVAFMRGYGPAAVVLLALFVASSASACGSSAAAVLPIQTIPQHVTLTLDASDGGTIVIGSCGRTTGAEESTPADCGGQVWLDARGGEAGSEAQQRGTETEADVDARAEVPISTGGATSTGAR